MVEDGKAICDDCVTTMESVEVPPMEEVIVDACVDRQENLEEEDENR